MTALRILHLTRDFPPQHSGGLSTAVEGLVLAEQEAGCECVVVSFDNYKPREGQAREVEASECKSPGGIPVIRVSEEVSLASALALLAPHACRIVHVHHEGLWDFAQEAAIVLKARTLLSLHVLQSEQDRLRACPPTRSSEAQARAMDEASLLHAPSYTVTKLLGENQPELLHKVRTIPLASAPSQPDDEGPVERAGADAPLLLYVGRFADINGFAQFLAALPKLFEAQPNLSAIAAGGLPGNERGAKRWHKRWAAMAGPHAERLQMPGWLGKRDLQLLYRRATLLVVPSWFETFGQVLLEGMRAGVPIVTTGAGALGELVDEKSALLVKEKDSDAITEGVLEILRNPAQATGRAMEASQRARESGSWSDRMPAFLALYTELYD